MFDTEYRNIAMVVFCLIVLTFTTVAGKDTAPHEVDCTGAKNGLHEIGCWGYADCVDGKPIINTCAATLVFDRASMTCVKPGTTNTDCFLPVDCTGRADGSYPDYADKCVTYYRCAGEKNLGRFYCPAQTAFNEALQICDYPHNLVAPCGPKPRPSTQMTSAPTTQTTPTTTTASTSTTQKVMQTSQLQIILTSSRPKPTVTSAKQPILPVIG